MACEKRVNCGAVIEVVASGVPSLSACLWQARYGFGAAMMSINAVKGVGLAMALPPLCRVKKMPMK